MRVVFFFKQKTAYEMRISDWSSDVCSSDLLVDEPFFKQGEESFWCFQRTALRKGNTVGWIRGGIEAGDAPAWRENEIMSDYTGSDGGIAASSHPRKALDTRRAGAFNRSPRASTATRTRPASSRVCRCTPGSSPHAAGGE